MIGRDYLVRQATTLLRMASVADDAAIAGSLAGKAADIKSYLDEGPTDRRRGSELSDEIGEVAPVIFHPTCDTLMLRAAECRTIAETILDGEARLQMLAVAEDYERAALAAEQRQSNGAAAMK